MGDGPGRFQEHQAAPGIAGNNAPSKGVSGQRDVVSFVIVTTQGKFEPILSGRGPMTRAGTASELGQDGLDLVAKAGSTIGVFSGGDRWGSSAAARKQQDGQKTN